MPEQETLKCNFSIIVPAFNEEDSIASTVKNLSDLRTKHSLNCEIIVVNDGSTDKTAEVLEDLKDTSDFKFINNGTNLGYGASLKRGILKADSDIICITDADGTYPIDRIPVMIKCLENFDMVVGAREGKDYWGSFIKTLARKIFLNLLHYITGVKIPDGNSGLRVFRKNLVLEFVNLIGNKYSFTTSLTIAAHHSGYSVKYIPIPYYKREGKSKVRHIRDSLGIIQLMLQVAMYFDPFKVVFPGFFLFAFISLCFFMSIPFGSGTIGLSFGFINLFFSVLLLLFGLISSLISSLIKKLH